MRHRCVTGDLQVSQHAVVALRTRMTGLVGFVPGDAQVFSVGIARLLDAAAGGSAGGGG